MISFTTNHQPVWGDFYARDATDTAGVWRTVQNNGFGNDPDMAATSFANWIPTPDSVVPEPVSLVIWGLGLGVAGVVAFARRCARR